MDAGLLNRGASAAITLYCRQVISRSDIRWSAAPSPPPPSLCSLLQWDDPLVPADSEGWLVGGQRSTSRPVRTCLFRLLLPHPAISLPPLLFGRLTVCISDVWGGHRSIWKIKRGGGFSPAVQVTQTWMHPSHGPSVLSVAQTACVCCQKTD